MYYLRTETSLKHLETQNTRTHKTKKKSLTIKERQDVDIIIHKNTNTLGTKRESTEILLDELLANAAFSKSRYQCDSRYRADSRVERMTAKNTRR